MPRKLSLRILLLLIFAVALSPVLVIGGLRWSSDIERETERRREMMSLVAEEAGDRAEAVLTAAPALLNVIDTLLAGDPCSPHINELIDELPQYSALGVIDANGQVLCTTMEGGEGASAADREWFQEMKSTRAQLHPVDRLLWAGLEAVDPCLGKTAHESGRLVRRRIRSRRAGRLAGLPPRSHGSSRGQRNGACSIAPAMSSPALTGTRWIRRS